MSQMTEFAIKPTDPCGTLTHISGTPACSSGRWTIPGPVKSNSFNAQPGTDRRLVRRLSLSLGPGKSASPAGR